MAQVAAGMISASSPGAAALAARLAAKAGLIARSRSESSLREGRTDPLRWRKPGLLWPLFTKD